MGPHDEEQAASGSELHSSATDISQTFAPKPAPTTPRAGSILGRLTARVQLKSVRLRLTLWYVLLLGLALIFFSVVLYVTLDNTLNGQLNSSLQQSADQALGAITVTSGQVQVPKTEGESELTPLGERGVLVRVVSTAGNTIESDGPFRTLPVPPELLTAVREGRSLYHDVLAHQVNGETPMRLYGVPVPVNDTVYGGIIVGESLAANQGALRQLLIVLVLAVPLTLLCASAGGLFLASRALQPIDRITRTAQRISAQNLQQRLNLALPDDEVGRLASTFDTMLARLDEAFRRQRQFTADASHELRTPLAIMKGNIGVSLNRTRSADQYKVVLADIEEEVDRLTRLVDDLLLLARGDGATPLLHVETLGLADLVGVAVEHVKPLAASKSISILCHTPNTFIKGDYDKLLRLILNLLDNAIKFTPNNGQIAVTVSSRRPGSEATGSQSNKIPGNAWAVVEVKDTGPGIPGEQLKNIFERFYRVDSARTRSGGGAGLGLSIARWVAEAHGGHIEVESKEGEGSTFSVWLPTSTLPRDA